jgi:hypothetical protein
MVSVLPYPDYDEDGSDDAVDAGCLRLFSRVLGAAGSDGSKERDTSSSRRGTSSHGCGSGA